MGHLPHNTAFLNGFLQSFYKSMHQAMDLKEEELMELPPGFRFHPTDEELITHYLSRKFIDDGFTSRAIGDVDLNNCEPWDLPRRAKMGGKEWYFFCVRDRKYPTGLRTNRATEAGYWKATGKDKEIYRGKSLVGMKKTLVFYSGRAPKGENTNWVMHEYRAEGKYSALNLSKTAKKEWVISKVFNKSSKKVVGLARVGTTIGDELGSCPPPPLMDAPYDSNNSGSTAADSAHVTCFSNAPYFFPTKSAELLMNSMILQKMQSPLFNSDSSFMGLLAEGSCKRERQRLSIAQETELTTAEISSVLSNNGMGQDLDDCLWVYS